MRKSVFSALFILVLVATSAKAQTWDQKPTNEKITLVDATGKTTVLDPGVLTPTILTKRLNSLDWSFLVRGATADTLVAAPVTVDLGEIIPKKRNFQIQIVKLGIKAGNRIFVMKTSNNGFYPLKEFELFDQKYLPVPVRGENGHWKITIPQTLEPGEYAVISDGDIWEFAVKK